MNYSTLTPAQQAQAAYLFADDVFGTDPNAYDYEVNGKDIIGRSCIAHNSDRIHARKPHSVSVNVAVRQVPDEFITSEMSRNAEQAINDFARSAVERITQSQTQEA
jgi:hypothetical protein